MIKLSAKRQDIHDPCMGRQTTWRKNRHSATTSTPSPATTRRHQCVKVSHSDSFFSVAADSMIVCISLFNFCPVLLLLVDTHTAPAGSTRGAGEDWICESACNIAFSAWSISREFLFMTDPTGSRGAILCSHCRMVSSTSLGLQLVTRRQRTCFVCSSVDSVEFFLYFSRLVMQSIISVVWLWNRFMLPSLSVSYQLFSWQMNG